MIIRLVMLGTGEAGDPFYADLPSYSTLATDEVNMTMTVSVSSRNNPPQVPPAGPPYWSSENGVNVLIGMPEEMVMAWWQQLATKYPGRQPPYTPGFPS